MGINTTYTFKPTDFGFSDGNDNPPDNLTAVKITSLPLAGALTDNNATVTLNQEVLVGDITGGAFVFTPTAGQAGVNYANFNFAVEDSGSTVNGGVTVDPSPDTITITVVNTAPAITSNGGAAASLSRPENSKAVTTVTAFDPDPNTTLTYSIVGGTDQGLFQIDALSGALSHDCADPARFLNCGMPGRYYRSALD